MSHSGNDYSSSEVSTVEEGYDSEFRSPRDDAWYSVRLVLEGERGDKLRVKFENFPDDHDNVFLAGSFKSLDELAHFAVRFRKVSAQLQDHECSKVVRGTRVCASDDFGGEEFRFYDAIIDEVVHKKHSYENGEEECQCRFLLFWEHGPNAGYVSDKEVANICIPQSAELEPKLVSFMEIALNSIEKSLCKSASRISNDSACSLGAQCEENCGAIVKPEPCISGGERQGKCALPSFSKVWPSEADMEWGNVRSGNRQDTDLGGEKKNHIILVQNLEKQLSSITLLEFIQKQTSTAPEVYIFPSLPWEPYTNGIIVLDHKNDLEKVLRFLKNTNHFIVSSNGRPLVACEKMSTNARWSPVLDYPKISPDKRARGLSAELKVVHSGTEEYERANKLSALFLGFINHQQALHEKLSEEEGSILSLLK